MVEGLGRVNLGGHPRDEPGSSLEAGIPLCLWGRFLPAIDSATSQVGLCPLTLGTLSEVVDEQRFPLYGSASADKTRWGLEG